MDVVTEEQSFYWKKVKFYLRHRARMLLVVDVYPNLEAEYGTVYVENSLPIEK